jgi:hypothetical protein
MAFAPPQKRRLFARRSGFGGRPHFFAFYEKKYAYSVFSVLE